MQIIPVALQLGAGLRADAQGFKGATQTPATAPHTAPRSATVHIGAAPTAPPAELKKVAALFDAALKFQRARNYTQALATYSKLLAIAPRAYPAFMNMGIIYGQMHNYPAALASFTKAAATAPADALPLTQLATTLLQLKQFEKARDMALKAVTLAPKSAPAHFALADSFTALHKPAIAEREYRLVVRLMPQNARGFFNLASSLATQRKLAEAIVEYRHAITLDPHMAPGWFYLGVLQQTLKQYAAAIHSDSMAVSLMPGNWAPMYNMAACQQSLGESTKSDVLLNESISSYVLALKLNPRLTGAQVNLARLYFRLRNYREAALHYEAATLLSPQDTHLQGDAALAETWAGNSAQDKASKAAYQTAAIAHFKNALTGNAPQSAYTGLAYLYIQRGDTADAAAVYQNLLNHYPKYVQGMIALGQLREQMHLVPQAEEMYRAAMKLEPGNTMARAAFVHLCETNHRLSDAIAVYNSALAVNPKSVELHRSLGDLYQRIGKPTLAIAELEKAWDLNPHDINNGNVLAGLYEQTSHAEDALRVYKTLAAENRADTQSEYSVARLLEALKRYDEAVAQYQAMESDPVRGLNAGFSAARLLEQIGKTDAAVAEYRQLVTRQPVNVDIRRQLADLLDKHGKPALAAVELQAVVKLNPRAAWAWLRIGQLDEQVGNIDAARIAYATGLDADPSSYDAYANLGRVYRAQKQLPGWIDVLKQKLTAQPSNVIALSQLEMAYDETANNSMLTTFLDGLAAGTAAHDRNFLLAYASMLTRRGHADEAMTLYNKVLEINPNDIAIRALVASLLAASGKTEAAIAQYRHILSLPGVIPTSLAPYHVRLAALYEKLGQKKDAADEYRAALVVEPTNSAAHDGLKRVGG